VATTKALAYYTEALNSAAKFCIVHALEQTIDNRILIGPSLALRVQCYKTFCIHNL